MVSRPVILFSNATSNAILFCGSDATASRFPASFAISGLAVRLSVLFLIANVSARTDTA
jgi:hypothetical protein